MKPISAIGANFKLSTNTWQISPLVLGQRLLCQAITTTSSPSCDGKNYFLFPTIPFVSSMVHHSLGFTIVATMPPHAHYTATTFILDRSSFSPFIWSLSHLQQVLVIWSFKFYDNCQHLSQLARINQLFDQNLLILRRMELVATWIYMLYEGDWSGCRMSKNPSNSCSVKREREGIISLADSTPSCGMLSTSCS